ncbi:MAG: class I SAM-dependent methyltransferase [Acidimicrobiales bacterium]
MDRSTGLIAPDGSPVEVFRALPPGAAPAIVAAVLEPGGSVLDLGAGAGRLSHALAAQGFRVTAVDVSAAMVAAIEPPVATVCADIEHLELGRRFDAVVMASYLVNDRRAEAFLATCARHVAPDGVVLVQRYDPLWIADATPDAVTTGNVTVAVESLAVDDTGDGFTMIITYGVVADGVDSRRWSQRVDARVVDDDRLDALAATAGLSVERWLDEYRTWASLRRSQPGGQA